jgi:hypothetical protein
VTRDFDPGLALIGMTGRVAEGVIGAVYALPVQMGIDARGVLSMLVWLPMLLFEIVLAVWLLVRCVAPNGHVPAHLGQTRGSTS